MNFPVKDKSGYHIKRKTSSFLISLMLQFFNAQKPGEL
ncbi:Uncharacterized protein dnm_037420 [Desulfonema magnum]|uniref:Uncharacterized protein n=1 Tax=Desulfonema magnum TaxID=45655 RepID=A0A975BM55_9BACT|nr:Uncharacterized protein dnm_037420 [Desulfonema magnum]